MEELAQGICDIFHDYHSFDGFKLTPDHVINWVSQFGEVDQHFILSEFYYVCSNQKIYVSEKRAKKMFKQLIEKLTKDYKSKDEISFLKNADFLKMQDEDNSQTSLLKVLDDLIRENYGIGIDECGTISKKYAVYIDDIIATGRTVLGDCEKWLALQNTGR